MTDADAAYRTWSDGFLEAYRQQLVDSERRFGTTEMRQEILSRIMAEQSRRRVGRVVVAVVQRDRRARV